MPELKGTVEDIIFQNEENGYVVANIKTNEDVSTIVGCIPYIIIGQNLRLEGKWVEHPQFGKQFKVEKCEELLPDSLTGIEKYLSSGIISGIGPVTAKKIVDKFKEKTLDIFDHDINRLKEIEGIGDKKVDDIYESYMKHREVKNIMVFLQTYGVTANQCMKIYNRYGADSVEKVKQNPYVLVDDISGFGFKTSDKIARSLGTPKDSPFRIQSGIRYVINMFCRQGNTYMPLEKLIKEGIEVLNVSNDDIEKNIYECAVKQKIKIEEIEGKNCVFTIPYYTSETMAANKLMTLAFAKYDSLNIDIDKEIQDFEKENDIEFSDSQKDAIQGAVANSIEVITGGPGTGKTTIIKCITQIFEKEGFNVLMAAPTGRAAKRMTETTGAEAKTIHRLLEIGYGDENELEFARNEESTLECDVLIVDEASMIDIILMNSLLKAISLGTRFIIVGDSNQLPSVGPGNVLKDIIDSKCIKVVALKEIFRQSEKSMIILNAHRINNGEMPVLNEKGKDFFFMQSIDMNKTLNTIVDVVSRRLPKFNANWNSINNIQVLSPMKKGMLGSLNLNKRLQSVLNPLEKAKKEREYKDITFRVGDKVMQIKNNYNMKWRRVKGDGENEGIGVFNGDIGFITDIDEENNTITVLFDNEREIEYDSTNLDELELAYAITIHKSQGSEFDVVIIPVFMGPPLLMYRNLLYTGITRAREFVVLIGELKAVKMMVTNTRSFERYSSLRWRIENIVERG